MTAYAAFQNPTEWSFQKQKEEVKSNAEMHVTITKYQKKDVIYAKLNTPHYRSDSKVQENSRVIIECPYFCITLQ